MQTDHRCMYQQGQPGDVVVPAPLLWAFLGSVWGTRARVASKGVWGMRLCKIIGSWWDTQLRVGGLPDQELQPLMTPEFGEPVCYIVVTVGKPTRAQQAWYTRAQVHNKVQQKVHRWGQGAYTVMCVATSEYASAWAHAILSTLDNLND